MTGRPPPTWPRRWVVVVALAAAYVVTARLGLLLALPPEKKATAVWPPSGLALAALLLFGRRAWPGVFLGAFCANLCDYLDPANFFSLPAHLGVSFGIAAGSSLQAVAGATLLRRWVGGRNPLDHTLDVFRFVGAALLACLVAASFGVTSLGLGGFAPWGASWFIWWTWWLGDATGVLLFAPLVLTWRKLPTPTDGSGSLREAFLLAVVLVITGLVVFTRWLPYTTGTSPLAYLTVPLLVWATLRFGPHGATATLVFVSGVAVWGTAGGAGPFAVTTLNESLLLLQVFMGVLVTTALALSSVLTERRMALVTATEAGAKVATLIGNIPASFFTLDHGWRYTHVNPQWAALVGKVREEVEGQVIWEVFPAVLGTVIEEQYRKVMRERVPARFEAFSPYARRWIEVSAFPIPEGLASYIHDINDRKQAETVLRDSEQRLRTLADAVPGFLFTNQPDGRTDYTSQTFYDYTGLPPGSADGYGWAESLHPDDRGPARERYLASVRDKARFLSQYRFRSAGGAYRWFQARCVPMLDEQGRVVKWYGICTDIDDQKQAEEALEQSRRELEDRIRERTAQLHEAKEAAEAANRAKGEFLANISHEVRTPLNGILGMADLVLGTRLDEGQRDSLGLLRRSAEGLLKVINDILDFSKIEAGRLELDLSAFSVRELVRDTLRLFEPQARRKGLRLSGEVADEVPAVLVADAGRLRQVVLNLVGNAVKFTERGEVELRVDLLPLPVPGLMQEEGEGERAGARAGEGAVRLRFAVRDTGIGIPVEKRAAIFQPFVQADGSLTRKYGGTGLGLTISACLVEKMGGRLEVESTPAVGSSFHFTLPFATREEAPAAPPAPAGEAAACALEILLVEDNHINQLVSLATLEKAGHKVAVAGDGKQALDILERRSFDLVLMDVQMPVMDGLEATAIVREREKGTGRRLPILAFTAHARKADRDRCLAAGMDGIVTKPVREEELHQAIRGVVSPKPQSRSSIAAVRPSDILDRDALLRRVGGDARLVKAVVALFETEGPRRLGELRAAVAGNDLGRLRTVAHTLKGTLSSLSAIAAAEAARRLEGAARENDLDGAGGALALLEAEVGRAIPALVELKDSLG